MAAIRCSVFGLRSEERRIFLLGALILLVFLLVTMFYSDIACLKCETSQGSPAPEAPRPARQAVLLVSYCRSGSTFTSALLDHHSGVFFVFEPLYPVNLPVTDARSQNISTAIVHSFMSCAMPPEHAFALYNRHFQYLEDTADMYNCLVSRLSGFHHVKCYTQFLKDCLSRATLLVKTIRFRVAWAETFLQGNPHFKLLYLVRDPRPTLFSQAQIIRSFLWPTDIINASQSHCAILDDDVKEAVRLAKLYPGRVKGIRYEHGATDPFSYTKDIYNFLGLDYDDEVVSFVENITTSSASAPDFETPFGVHRRNSTETMNKWRQEADFPSIKIIDTICGFTYGKLGYKFVESLNDLRSSRGLVSVPDLNIFQQGYGF